MEIRQRTFFKESENEDCYYNARRARGSAVADFLTDFGGDIKVKLLARRPKDLQKYVERGAELEVGSLDEEKFLAKATQDADALFWATPPGRGSGRRSDHAKSVR